MINSIIIYGLVNSVMLALIAMGFSLTFGISGVANFAYGGFYILSGFIGSLNIPSLPQASLFSGHPMPSWHRRPSWVCHLLGHPVSRPGDCSIGGDRYLCPRGSNA